MAESMIEKAARAMANNIEGADADSCYYAVRAVLEVIREPSEAMHAAALEDDRLVERSPLMANSRSQTYTRMIDSILEGE